MHLSSSRDKEVERPLLPKRFKMLTSNNILNFCNTFANDKAGYNYLTILKW